LNWVEWIQRTTHQAEAKFAQLNIEDWVTGCHKTKLEWAGALAENKQNWVSRVLLGSRTKTNISVPMPGLAVAGSTKSLM